MRILVAPDGFGCDLPAAQVVDALATGLLRIVPGLTIDRCPAAVAAVSRCARTDDLPDLPGVGERITRADLVITGQNVLDARALCGAAADLAAAAARHGRPAVAVARRIELGVAELARAGFVGGYALGDLEPDPRRRISDAVRLVEDIGARIITDWLRGEAVRGT